jgi:hypothetical protein
MSRSQLGSSLEGFEEENLESNTDEGYLELDTNEEPEEIDADTPAPQESQQGLSDDEINKIAKENGIKANLTEEQIAEIRRVGAVAMKMQDPKQAASVYKVIAKLISDSAAAADIAKKVKEYRDAGVKDYALNDFLGVLESIAGLESEEDRKVGFAKTSKEFAFLADKKLSPEKRIGKSTIALGNITKEEEEQKAEHKEEQKKEEVGKLSKEAKAKIAKDAEANRKKFAEENEGSITAGGIAVNLGKAAVCAGLAVALPGFGIFLAAGFLYATKDFGNNSSKVDELKKELESLKKDGDKSREGGYDKIKKSSPLDKYLLEGSENLGDESNPDSEPKPEPEPEQPNLPAKPDPEKKPETELGKNSRELAQRELEELRKQQEALKARETELKGIITRDGGEEKKDEQLPAHPDLHKQVEEKGEEARKDKSNEQSEKGLDQESKDAALAAMSESKKDLLGDEKGTSGSEIEGNPNMEKPSMAKS